MQTSKSSKCVLKDNDREYSITAEVFYDDEKEFDEGELFFRHVMTNSLCQTAEQCLQGWSEFEKVDNDNWSFLVESISNDDMLIQKIFDDVEIIKYYK